MKAFYDILGAVDLFFYKVRKILSYLPVLWKESDSDYESIYLLLRFKLSRMEKLMASAHHDMNRNICRQIKYAIFLLDRITSDTHHRNASRDMTAKWGESYMRDPDLIHPSGARGWSKPIVGWENARTDEQDEQAYQDYRDGYNKAAQLVDKDYARLFRHLQKYSRNWWD